MVKNLRTMGDISDCEVSALLFPVLTTKLFQPAAKPNRVEW